MESILEQAVTKSREKHDELYTQGRVTLPWVDLDREIRTQLAELAIYEILGYVPDQEEKKKLGQEALEVLVEKTIPNLLRTPLEEATGWAIATWTHLFEEGLTDIPWHELEEDRQKELIDRALQKLQE